MSKASLPNGTRDFLPIQLLKRKYMFNIIESVFKAHGYVAIETPAMENLSSLTGQYGDEGDKLLFKVLNNGDFLSKLDDKALIEKDSKSIVPLISKRGLRYDLTIPFARYVVMHQSQLNFPFKRYAIQPVWRADRPQKGRYQEFYQCDVDVVGSDSLLYEAELVSIYDKAFSNLGIGVNILVNNRKILEGIAEKAGVRENFSAFAVGIDKLDKIGENGVKAEFQGQGISIGSVETIFNLLKLSSIDQIEKELGDIEIARQGVLELKKFHSYIDQIELKNNLTLDLTLARGLSYYTGCIFEVKALDVNMGSIGGGGRYDNLTEVFGMSGNSGVGISFGAERIYDLMEEKGLFDESALGQTQVVILSFDEASLVHAFLAAFKLRQLGLTVDVYPEAAKFKKQMKYASDNNYPFAIIIGEEERNQNRYTLKNMKSGAQEKVELNKIPEIIEGS